MVAKVHDFIHLLCSFELYLSVCFVLEAVLTPGDFLDRSIKCFLQYHRSDLSSLVSGMFSQLSRLRIGERDWSKVTQLTSILRVSLLLTLGLPTHS